MQVLTDAEIRDVSARVSVAAAREAVVAYGSCELRAPPRTRSDLGDLEYLDTSGNLRTGPSGLCADRARTGLSLPEGAVAAPDSPRAAVRDADLVVLATRSTTPIVDSSDIAPGAHVTTVGPEAQEIPPELVASAAVVTCDSPEQASSSPGRFVVGPDRMTSLADVLLGRAPGRRRSEDITVHCSVGLAGSEMLIAYRLLA